MLLLIHSFERLICNHFRTLLVDCFSNSLFTAITNILNVLYPTKYMYLGRFFKFPHHHIILRHNCPVAFMYTCITTSVSVAIGNTGTVDIILILLVHVFCNCTWEVNHRCYQNNHLLIQTIVLGVMNSV